MDVFLTSPSRFNTETSIRHYRRKALRRITLRLGDSGAIDCMRRSRPSWAIAQQTLHALMMGNISISIPGGTVGNGDSPALDTTPGQGKPRHKTLSEHEGIGVSLFVCICGYPGGFGGLLYTLYFSFRSILSFSLPCTLVRI